MSELKEKIKEAVNKHLDTAIALSKDLAEHPELPYQEFESSRKMAEILKEAGFEVTYPYAGYDTAYCAKLDNGDGPSVALLAEYDALPEIGHGCGLSVLSGLALIDLKDKFKGTLYVIGTPAEEENGAKIGMAEQGIFDDMSMAVMMHSSSGGYSLPDMDVLSLRCYEVEFFGETAHAVAAPWNGKSALSAARKFLDLIDARRECFTPDIHVNSVILDGGKAPNIIPDYSKMSRLEKVDEMIKKCANAAAMALDCTVTLTFGLSDFADMVRNYPLENKITELMAGYGLKVGDVPPASGSSDVGNISYRCPAMQSMLSITDENFALHTRDFRDATLKPKAHDAMAKGACCLADLSLKIFNDDSFRSTVYEAWQKELKNKQSD